MKKIIIALFLTVGLFSSAYAQDTRTRETKIADVVMQLPADNTKQFNQLMNELIQLGDVVSYLSPRLADPGGNDAQIRYAISGLAMYASKDNAKKKMIAEGLCKSIPQAKSDEIRDFLFIQLQYVAGSESVETAARYISNSRLCDAALRVLVRIDEPAANEVMLEALKKSDGIQQIRLVEALGDARYQPAADVITPLAGSSNIQLQKVVLHSLAEIASPGSEKILVKAAETTRYVYEPTDALGSLVLYMQNSLTKQGGMQAVSKISKNLLKATSESSQLAAKTAALDLYVRSSRESAIGEVMKALDSDNKSYRQAALNYSAGIVSSKMDDNLLKRAKGEKRGEVKGEIIMALGRRGNPASLPFILESVKSNNPPVCNAAIIAASQLGKEQAIPSIINLMAAMAPGNVETIETAKNCLLSMRSESVIPAIAAAIPKTSIPARVMFLEILGLKKAQDQSEVVFSQVDDLNVGLTAKKVLKDVVTGKDVQRVAQLLNASASSGKEGIAALQQALFAAVSSVPQAQQFKLVSAEMNKSSNPSLYYNVLAMIGGKEPLDLVLKGFENNATRSAAFEALTLWSDDSAVGSLYSIAAADPSGAYFDKALASYVAKVSASKATPEQKLLQLRDALEIAKTGSQKQGIINQISRTGTFLGLLTVGKYLESSDNQVQQAAVQAVRTIALGHKEYFGPEVVALLNKAMAVNKDSEADYQKQAILKHLAVLPQETGFVSMFNGKDLSGWKGLVENPIARGKMTAKQLAEKQVKADEAMRKNWRVENGLLVYEGKGFDNICSEKMYGDFELYVDWRIAPEGDAGIYLRGSPQVQIWDTALTKVGAQVGSGGLYNNQKHPSKPLVVADNPVNEWNSFYIRMIGEKVTVYLNGQLVVDNVTLENYWNRALPIFPKDAIELQAHGNRVEYRDVYVREIPRPEPYEVSAAEKAEGFIPMFNGVDMSGWVGNLKDYIPRDGMLVCDPQGGGHGNLYTDKEYSDFVMRFDFRLTPAANNGLGIRTPLEGDAAYVGMELQILDNEADVYKDLKNYQYHGSVYGVIAAKRGYLKPVGEWNTQEVVAKGNHIKVTLNGVVILDGDIAEASKNFTQPADKKKHPGLSNKSGHIAFLGHGSVLDFRNLRIKDLSK